MYKEELIHVVAAKSGQPIAVTRRIVNETLEAIKDAMMGGVGVTLSGFGTFELKHRSQRVGRNPHTGEAVDIPARIVPSFKPAKTMLSEVSEEMARPSSLDSPFVK